tara:strand:+ start:148 stop:357 length:210 start_codon:yes stop_codon:yes gene_type:complete
MTNPSKPSKTFDVIVHDIGADNSWAQVEKHGQIFEVSLASVDGFYVVTDSPINLSDADIRIIEREVESA